MKLEELKELERIEREAEKVREKTRRERNDFIHGREQAAREAIRKEAAERFGATFEAQHQAYVAARLAADEARIEYAESFADAPYPKGQRFVKWYLVSYPRKWMIEKDSAGVIEVVTHDTVHPERTSRIAEVGSYIIRLLKKDGTPSKKYERIHRDFAGKWHLPWDWYPEGFDKDAEERAILAKREGK